LTILDPIIAEVQGAVTSNEVLTLPDSVKSKVLASLQIVQVGLVLAKGLLQ